MRGLSIVVYGCFDLFHEGHKYLLNIALKNSFEGYIYFLLYSDSLCKISKNDRKLFDDLTIRSENIQRHIFNWCKENCESPRLKINIINSMKELTEKINFYSPNMIIQGEDSNILDHIDDWKWPTLMVPCLKDKNKNVFSTTKRIKEILK